MTVAGRKAMVLLAGEVEAGAGSAEDFSCAIEHLLQEQGRIEYGEGGPALTGELSQLGRRVLVLLEALIDALLEVVLRRREHRDDHDGAHSNHEVGTAALGEDGAK